MTAVDSIATNATADAVGSENKNQEQVAGLDPFHIERYFNKYEFCTKYLLSSSDCEAISQKDLVELASPRTRELWDNLSLGYTYAEGLPELRVAVAERYGKNINKDNVTILTPCEGITLSIQALELGVYDEVIVPGLGYQILSEIAKTTKCTLKSWNPIIDEKGNWKFHVDDLKKLVNKGKTRLIIANFPHNPTGALLSHDEWQDVITLCKDLDCWLFSDEMYRGLELAREIRLESACDVYSKAIMLSGVSKVVSAPGLRIGWIISQNKEFVRKLRHLRDYSTICSAAPSEVLALIAVENWDYLESKNMELIKAGKAAAAEFFNKRKNKFLYHDSPAGSTSFVKLLGDENESQFCEKMNLDHGILLVPGSCFGSKKGNFFRIGLGRKNIPEIFKVFSNIIVEDK